MIQTSPSTRLKSLDGLRGLAILAVFLNHIDPVFALKILPSFILPFSGIIFASGVMGVSFLFVLSGFLMAYIYPNPKEFTFLQKRYTRIFPLFLTMCAVMVAFRVFPNLVGVLGVGLILLLAVIVHIIWVYGVKKMPANFGKRLFYSFFLLQILMAGIYVFWIMRHPPIVFNQQLPITIREGTIGLVNATLTLPLGNYIPMLDGVYWSLAGEILFYILYPVLFVPVVNFLIPQKKKLTFLFLIALAPLIAGLDLLSHRIFGLSMLQLPLFYCFVTGITLGYLYRNKPEIVHKVTGIFQGWRSFLSIIIFIGTIFLYHFFLDPETPYASWLHILFAIPFAFIIGIALDQRNALSKMFSSKILVFFGIISYSIYLSHTAIIHIVNALFKPSTVITTFMFVLIIFVATIVLSYILHFLLEKPYFIRPKEVKKPVQQSIFAAKPAFIALTFLSLIYLFSVFSAYQSSFNFFSVEYPAKQKFISPQLNNQQLLSMQTYPLINMQIQSDENNLGIIAMHIKHEIISKNTQNTLTFHIKEEGAKEWYATTSYKLNTLGDSFNHPFGFPPIQNSKGKAYDVQLQLTSYDSPDYVFIDTSQNSIRTVYPVSKSQLIRHPSQFISFAQKRVLTVFSNKEAQMTFFLFTPFFLLGLLLFLQRGLVSKKL